MSEQRRCALCQLRARFRITTATVTVYTCLTHAGSGIVANVRAGGQVAAVERLP